MRLFNWRINSICFSCSNSSILSMRSNRLYFSRIASIEVEEKACKRSKTTFLISALGKLRSVELIKTGMVFFSAAPWFNSIIEVPIFLKSVVFPLPDIPSINTGSESLTTSAMVSRLRIGCLVEESS